MRFGVSRREVARRYHLSPDTTARWWRDEQMRSLEGPLPRSIRKKLAKSRAAWLAPGVREDLAGILGVGLRNRVFWALREELSVPTRAPRRYDRAARQDSIMVAGHLFDFAYRGEEAARQTLKAEFMTILLHTLKMPMLGFTPRDGKSPGASRSRLVRKIRKLVPRCSACAAAGRGKPIAKTFIERRMDSLVSELQSKQPGLSQRDALIEDMHTNEGKELYRLYTKYFEWSLEAVLADQQARAEFESSGVPLFLKGAQSI